jgi:hypothetical protein
LVNRPRSAEVAELCEDGDERIVCALFREIVVVAAAICAAMPATRRWISNRAVLEQEGAELPDRHFAIGALRAQAIDPPLRLGIQMRELGGGHDPQEHIGVRRPSPRDSMRLDAATDMAMNRPRRRQRGAPRRFVRLIA